MIDEMKDKMNHKMVLKSKVEDNVGCKMIG